MASSVEVVLKENLEHLGSIGDVVRVRRGYARNYLLPRGLAVLASRGNVRQIEHVKEVQARRVAKLRGEQEYLVAELAKVTVMVAKEAGEDGKLFGSVTNADIADRANETGTLDFEVDKRTVVLEEPLKTLGVFQVPVHLHAEVDVEIEVRVEREGS